MAMRLAFRRCAALLTIASPLSRAMSTPARIIDSHLHVWANQAESQDFPYAQEPPDSLQDEASVDKLLALMARHSIDGALIVQPINHQYDHRYVLGAIRAHPDRFKGMLLHDPSLDAEAAVARLEELALGGFVGVRFNPYLWPKVGDQQWEPMSQGAGLAVYRRCGELRMPVGVMCFQGLSLHYNDIIKLLNESPSTPLILDHFGFTALDDDAAFDKLLSLAAYPQVHVKISALFRLGDQSPFTGVYQKRFLPLLKTFGADRLLFGSDFPFVLEQPEAYGMVDVVKVWLESDAERQAVLGGTAEKLFGAWSA